MTLAAVWRCHLGGLEEAPPVASCWFAAGLPDSAILLRRWFAKYRQQNAPADELHSNSDGQVGRNPAYDPSNGDGSVAMKH